MKNNIKIISKRIFTIFLCFGFLSLSSCDDDFGDINKDFKATIDVRTVTIPALYNGLVASLKKNRTEYRIPVAWLYQWNQQAAMYSASGFLLQDWNDTAWKSFYTSLANMKDLENLIASQENPANYANNLAMAKVIMAYKTLRTTLLYGDMPYTEAGFAFLDNTTYRPKYDSQQSIMEAAINDLTWAIDNLSTGSAQVPLGSSDVLFSDDINEWIKFANSLRLRYAMVMIEKNASFADPVITAALNLPLLAANEYVSLAPETIEDLTHKRDNYYRGNSYIRMGTTMWDAMSSTNAVDGSGIYDLRCPILFEPNKDEEWVPYPQIPDNNTPTVTGNPAHRSRINNYNRQRSNFASFHAFYMLDNSIPQFIVTGSQVSFLMAEIYNRGLAGKAVDHAMAETYYNAGITASVNFWYNHAFNSAEWKNHKPAAAAPTALEMDGMLTDVNVSYSADPATALSQIYKQSWISLIHQPFEAWNLQRRTDNATPGVTLPSTSLVIDFNRLTYPNSEQESNRENWTTVTGGTDSEKNKTWIQK